MAAAFLAPTLALANDPAQKQQKTHATDLTSTQVLGKLRMIHLASMEMGNIAQSNSASVNVKSLGKTLVKEHQALDTRLTEYCAKNNIVLSGGTTSTGPLATPTYGMRLDPTADMGARGSSGHNDSMPSGGTASSNPVQGDVEKLAKREEQMNELRSLRGSDFDREFLSRVVEKGNTWIGVLQENKGKFDKTVDGQITKTIDTLKKNVAEAQRLSTTLRST